MCYCLLAETCQCQFVFATDKWQTSLTFSQKKKILRPEIKPKLAPAINDVIDKTKAGMQKERQGQNKCSIQYPL